MASQARGSHSRLSLVACGASLLLLLGVPSGASAGEVSTGGDAIQIDGTGQQERLLVRQIGSTLRIDERNPERSLATSDPSCTATALPGGRSRVECPMDGVRKIEVALRGGNDRFGVGTRLPTPGGRNFCRGGSLDAGVRLRAGAGRDVAELGSGADRALGGSGADLLMGCRGADRLQGGAGGDHVSGDRGADALRGGGGGDWIVGCQFDPDDVNYPQDERGNDVLSGDNGSDFLYGCSGRDDFFGGKRSDTINSRDGRAEVVRCSSGSDLVYGDRRDRLAGCEQTTRCTTDNFPFFPCNRGPKRVEPAAPPRP